MPTATLVSSSGEKVGEIELSEMIFAAKVNKPLLHQAVIEELANLRSGTADTKTRGEVRGGGKKPYRQKGTGRARQGTVSAPHYPGGGVAFGPHPRSYEQHMPRKMKKAALRAALTGKLADGELMFVEDIMLDSISTKQMAQIMKNLGVAGRVMLVVTEISEELGKSARNIQGLELRVAPAIAVAEVIDSNRVIITKTAAARLEEAFGK